MASATDLTQFVFRGMRDSEDPQTENPEYARLLQNCYPIDTTMGTRVIGRGGCSLYNASQLGGASHRVQGIFDFIPASTPTNHYLLCVCGGKLYQQAVTGGALPIPLLWVEKTLSAATLDTGATVYFTALGDVAVISDGVHTPFSWDGTTDTVLTNCPVLFGRPTVYYAKLFGIKNTERSTIVWSEEGDPATGYEAGGYNNAWTLGQTDQDPLFALYGSNEALYYFRRWSIGAIRGSVDADFVNSGTRESVSATVGIVGPGGLVVTSTDLFFLDANNRPRALNIASGVLDDQMWRYIRETIPDFTTLRAYQNESLGAYLSSDDFVLLGGCLSTGIGSGYLSDAFIVISASTREVMGIWVGWRVTAMYAHSFPDGNPYLMFGSINGYTYQQLATNKADGFAAADGGTKAISHILTGSHLGSHIYGEKRFLRWDVDLWVPTDMALTFTYTTNRGTPTAQTKTIDLSSFPTTYHVAIGLMGCGRWIIPSISHGSATEGFGVERWSIQSVPYSMEPDIP